MNQTPESVDESRRRILEKHRQDRRKRLLDLADEVRRWQIQGRSLAYRIDAEIAGDESTVRLPRLPDQKQR